MYRIQDLDEPIKLLEASIKDAEDRKDPFPLAVSRVLAHVTAIQTILIDLQKRITGQEQEIIELIRRTDYIGQLSIKFNDLLEKREAQFMAITPQQQEPILPS